MAASELPEHPAQCDNCHSLLNGPFCHKCGQEKRNILRNAFGLVGEFFGEFSNWDARLWRTLLPLWFKPGQLTKRYVNGHRAPYVPALRLYLFSSIIAFLVFAKLVPTDDIQFNNTDGMFGLEYNPALNVRPEVADAIAKAQALNKGVAPAGGEVLPEKQQPAPVEVATVPANIAGQVSQTPAAKAPVKILELDGDEELESRIERLFGGKLARLKDNPQLAINKFFSLAPQMMFLLLPLFALLLKLLYLRQKRFYMEHLLLCLHSHSFILHMFIVFALLAYATPLSGSFTWLQHGFTNLSKAVLWYTMIYLFLSQKVFYGQGWVKTVLKFSIFSTAYIVLLSLALFVVLMLSLYWA